MVDNSVIIKTEGVDRDFFSQGTGSFNTELDNFLGTNVEIKDTNTQGLDRFEFDVFIKSFGAAAPLSGTINFRRKIIPENIPSGTPLVHTNFFTNVVSDVTTDFHVLAESDKDGQVIYTFYYTYLIGGGTGNLDLTIVTFKDPPNEFDPLPFTTNTPVQTKIVRRHVGGNQFVYDYFILSPS